MAAGGYGHEAARWLAVACAAAIGASGGAWCIGGYGRGQGLSIGCGSYSVNELSISVLRLLSGLRGSDAEGD